MQVTDKTRTLGLAVSAALLFLPCYAPCWSVMEHGHSVLCRTAHGCVAYCGVAMQTEHAPVAADC